MARGRGIASPESRKRAQTAARESRQRLENKFREDTREKFFKGREDVSDDRLDRRRQQDLAEQRFIRTRMKPVPGTGGTLLQEPSPVFNPMTGRYERTTLADKRMQLANKYGPTLGEVFSDIGYGLGSIGKGVGDFIGRGGVLGSVASDLFQRIKSGTQQGIETVGGLYDNLRNVFKGESQFVTPQAQGGIFEGQPIETTPQFPYNFETTLKPKPDPLLPSEMSQEQFMESFPELYSSLYQPRNYEPIRVSDMSMTGVTAQEGDRPVLPENVIPMMRVGEPMNIDQYKTPVLPPEVTDPRMYQGQTLYAQNFGLPSLEQSYNFLRNPQAETPLGNLRFDNVFSGNPQLGYGNTVMINGVPVDLSATIGQDQISGGLSFAFKKGGSVDKYAGLGYKLK